MEKKERAAERDREICAAEAAGFCGKTWRKLEEQRRGGTNSGTAIQQWRLGALGAAGVQDMKQLQRCSRPREKWRKSSSSGWTDFYPNASKN
ncbi:hypothetical protein F0562_005818 [Nyssa sinensis]|uniref:Uncharacterized protein n=1 Tax=Nyssa sinensis TaxID=561372 RepID=A0A5J5ALP7_9ASTE|nr:hypothetical protein F0562_005818 [Nyssa sinensis]